MLRRFVVLGGTAISSALTWQGRDASPLMGYEVPNNVAADRNDTPAWVSMREAACIAPKRKVIGPNRIIACAKAMDIFAPDGA